MLIVPVFVALLFTAATGPTAAAPLPGMPCAGPLVPVEFEVEWPTAIGTSVFVLGEGEALGAWEPLRAIKLEPGDYPTWRLQMGLPAGDRLTYRFATRRDDPESLEDPGNIVFEPGSKRFVHVPGDPAPRRDERRLYYHSGWSRPTVLWRDPGDFFWDAEIVLTRVGAGRRAGEWLWMADGVGDVCGEVEWAFTDGGTGRDWAPDGGAYRSSLPVALVQSGQVFSYFPGAQISPSQIVIVEDFRSKYLRYDRDLRIYLPRGYDEQPGRRYPVLYMHDGQNIYRPGGPFGTWAVEETADEEIGHGRVRELIIVGIDNTPARMNEYIPPEDGGTGDDYLQFCVEELLPYVNANFRTRDEPEDTGMSGSSLGGLISIYFGWERPDVFGRVGALSPSLWLDSLVGRLESEPRRSGRWWLDSGNAGPSNDGMWGTWNTRDGMFRNGYTLHDDLEHFIDYGAQHNEAAWRGRFWKVLNYLYPVSDDPGGFGGPQRRIGAAPRG